MEPWTRRLQPTGKSSPRPPTPASHPFLRPLTVSTWIAPPTYSPFGDWYTELKLYADLIPDGALGVVRTCIRAGFQAIMETPPPIRTAIFTSACGLQSNRRSTRLWLAVWISFMMDVRGSCSMAVFLGDCYVNARNRWISNLWSEDCSSHRFESLCIDLG